MKFKIPFLKFRKKQKEMEVIEAPWWINLDNLKAVGSTGANARILAEQGYKNCETVYSCINRIAKSISAMSFKLFRVTEDTEEELRKHILLELFKAPNPEMGGKTFIENLVGYWLISGNAYLYLYLGESKNYAEMYLLRPDRVRVKKSKGEDEIIYIYSVGGRGKVYTQEEVLHIKFFNPLNDLYGLSPISVCAQSVDIVNLGLDWNRQLLLNESRPSGVIFLQGILTPEQREELRRQFMEKYTGIKNIGKPIVIEGGEGMDWKQISLSPKDMDWLQSDKASTLKICSVFGVPPELIGMQEQKTYSNFQEARLDFVEHTIIPLMEILVEEFNRWLVKKFDNDLELRINYEKTPGYQAIQEKKWERAMKAMGLMTINEIRTKLLEIEPIEGGDVILIDGSKMPLSILTGNTEEE